MAGRPDDEDAVFIAEAEARLEVRLAEVEQAHAVGRLWDVVQDVPSVWEQVRPSIEKRL